MSGSLRVLPMIALLSIPSSAVIAQSEPIIPFAAPTLADLLEAEDAPRVAGAPGAVAGAKQTVPPAAERTAALGRVLEIFGDDIKAAKSADEKKKIAGNLIQYVDEASDRATHYVLLEIARRLGIEACDIQLARDTGQRLADAYIINPRSLEADALKTMAADAPSAKLGPVIDALLEVGRSNLPDSHNRAEELALAATTAARRAKDRERGAAAAQLLAEVRETKKRDLKTKPLLERLKQSPDDGEAALELGMIRCFNEQNWADGLRYLVMGSDAALALVAKEDVAAETNPSHRLAAADAWWDYGKSQKGIPAEAALQRARFRYTGALENAKGLDRARIEKRLESLNGEVAQKQPSSGWSPKTIGGLTWWLDASDAATVKLSGQAVTQWVDKGGGGRSFAQNEPQKCPSYRGLINGRKTIAFDGVDDYLKFVSPNEALCDPSGAAMFIVFQPDGDSVFSLYGQTNNLGVDLFQDNKTYHGYFRQVRMDGITDALRPTSLALLTSRTQATGNQTLRVNGEILQSAPSGFTAWRLSSGEAPGDAKNKTHTIGVNLVGSKNDFFFAGQIAELIMYGRHLGDHEVTTVEHYLKKKWGSQ